jgi:hypothetical protein
MAGVFVILVLMAGCADPAFETRFDNPCAQPVEFVYALVEPGGYPAPGRTEVIPVAPHGSEKRLHTTIVLAGDDVEALVTVVGLPGYEERLSEPVSRTITFDPSLCSEIVSTATEP